MRAWQGEGWRRLPAVCSVGVHHSAHSSERPGPHAELCACVSTSAFVGPGIWANSRSVGVVTKHREANFTLALDLHGGGTERESGPLAACGRRWISEGNFECLNTPTHRGPGSLSCLEMP